MTKTPTNTPTKTPYVTKTPTKTATPEVDEGCTPGYWKQSRHFDSWRATGYSPGQILESVFDVPNALRLDSVKLKAALAFNGGSGTTGAARILLRAAVAALLNAAHPEVDYQLTRNEVIRRVNKALASHNRSTMLKLASQFDKLNNLDCPLN